MKRYFLILAIILLASGLNAQTANDYEFIFTFEGVGVTTTLVSDMRRDNWAFTDGGHNFNDFNSLLRNSIGADFNRANYQRLVDYIIQNHVYFDLASFFILTQNIPEGIALNPTITGVEFSPTGRLTQVEIRLRFGNYNGVLRISKFPGMFIRELNEDFTVEYQQSNNKVHLYFIHGRR